MDTEALAMQRVGMGSAVGRGRGAVGARRGPGSVQALAGGEAEMGLTVHMLHAKYVGALAQARAYRGERFLQGVCGLLLVQQYLS